MEVTGS